MEQIQCVQISLKEFSFYGYSFDPEILHHMMDLEIDEIYEFSYESKKTKEVFSADIHEIDFTDTISILKTCDGYLNLHSIAVRFTNGLFFKFGEGVLSFHIDDEKLFLHYCSVILKQYGCFPEKVFELSRLHPGKELIIDRPGILFKVKEPNEQSDESVLPVE